MKRIVVLSGLLFSFVVLLSRDIHIRYAERYNKQDFQGNAKKRDNSRVFTMKSNCQIKES